MSYQNYVIAAYTVFAAEEPEARVSRKLRVGRAGQRDQRDGNETHA